jgi:hypothetical protein
MDCRVKPGNDDLLVTRFDLKRVTGTTPLAITGPTRRVQALGPTNN